MSNALKIEELFSKPGAPAYPFYDDRGQLCWLESLTKERGRLAFKQLTDHGERVITPAEFQVRTSVHEYGGKCFCVVGESVYFNHYTDGQIYRQNLHDDAAPVCILSRSSQRSAFADLFYADALHSIIAIEEIQGQSGTENKSQIVALALDSTPHIKPQILAEGEDFYANACVSNDGAKLAWIQWSHPNMPWDESQLMLAEIACNDGEISLVSPKPCVSENRTSVCQIGFLMDGSLAFAMDSCADTDSLDLTKNYWNLYRYKDGQTRALTHLYAEIGEAHWIFGQKRWLETKAGTLLAIATENEVDTLLEIDLDTGAHNPLISAASLAQLDYAQANSLCVAYYQNKPAQIIKIATDRSITVMSTLDKWIEADKVSLPRTLNFPTQDGDTAYANYYPASPLTNALSALIVLVHGGPTSRAHTALSPLIQYFCQNGLAVLDVNHRGSTGRGRRYRQKLLGEWGEIDAQDIADAIQTICKQHSLDPKRVLIRGGSAGGYAVLRALTRFPDLFCGGACYYGIGNLITLAEITHKFEGRYTDQLIGEVFDPEMAHQPTSRYTTRSPIFDIDKIESPLILFQGLDDKVVPPDVSREMVKTLKENGVKHEYIEYEGEGHGFRQANTRIDSLKREMAFYKDILG